MNRAVFLLATFVAVPALAGNFKSAVLADAVPGEWIVTFSKNKSAIENAVDVAGEFGAFTERTWYTAFNGAKLTGLDEKTAKLLAEHPFIESVEPNTYFYANGKQSNPPSWGLDRIDERLRQLDGQYAYEYDGSGVHAYILDTGIRISHNDFGGRAKEGFTSIDDGRGAIDCHGHGTHVAGTVGGAKYGIAKNVNLYAVRVLDCQGSGTLEGVLDGIEWVANNAKMPAVVNMSLGGSKSDALDEAVNNAVEAGIFFAVAAGNESANACGVSPARAERAFTVGSTTSRDRMSSFSNYGSCVDIFAPGSDITSTWRSNNSSTRTLSGTSMASPHVAGVAALLYEESPEYTVADIGDALLSFGTRGVLTGLRSQSPNILLYSLTDGEVPTCEPTEDAEESCEDGIDNDCDGLVDGDDDDCGGDPPPDQCLPQGSLCGNSGDCCSNFCFFFFCL